MNLGLFNSVLNNKGTGITKNFIKELSNYMEKNDRRIQNNMKNGLKEEGRLYQVVGISKDGVYLQNLKTNKVAEEKDISKELKKKLGNDYIVRYKNREYIFEKKLTDDFFNDLVDISKIK